MSASSQGPPAPGEASDPLVGQVLAGRYRILAKLGEGAMGAVYVGEHLHIGRRDAIKVLRPELAKDAEAIARFTRGTRNVSAIRHPNVCTIYDFSDTPEGVRYLAMEYVEGETLKQTLDRDGRLEPARAVEIARQVAEALQAAHDAGVVHRDLKPGNIMLCRRPDGRELVKVVDFDIAKGAAEAEGEEVTRLGFVVGTPEYMSPEQLTGDRLDGRSDLYSLAVMLFRMLSGTLPFRATSTQQIMVQRLTLEPLQLYDVAPDLKLPPALPRAITRALARRAEDRQHSTGEFAREITAALPAAPVAPPRTPARELAATRVAPTAVPARAPRKPSRFTRRQLTIAAAAVLLVVIGFAARALYREGRAPASPGDTASLDAAARSAAGVTGIVPASDSGAPPARAADTAAAADDRAPGTAPPERAASPAEDVGAMLQRQLLALSAGATGAQLRAVRDSGELGLQLATLRADSASAALVLAQAAFLDGKDEACLHYARLAVRLGGRGAAETLLNECR